MSAAKDWSQANQRYLTASLKMVRTELEAYQAGLNKADDHAANAEQDALSGARQELEQAWHELPASAAIDSLVSLLGLSPFERKILLLCAGVELEAGFSTLIAALQGNPALVHPSFSLALAAFPDAHWSAVSPGASLRYWNLITVNTDQLLTRSPLRIDEHILHYLTGIRFLDERLEEIIEPVSEDDFLVPSQAKLADDIVVACSPKHQTAKLPVIQLTGGTTADKTSIGAFACTSMGLSLYALSAFSIPGNAKETGDLVRMWNREAALNSYALFLDGSKLDTTDKPRLRLITGFIESVQGVLILGSDQWAGEGLKRLKLKFSISKPTREEQVELWNKGMAQPAERLNGTLDKVVSHFNLYAKTIETASRDVSAHLDEDAVSFAQAIWRTCCVHTRPQVDQLAQRIEPAAGWNDIILPEAQQQLLREIALQVKHRKTVYQDWGFSAKGPRGLGISALFTGESGTGKTMASEVLANELQLDLYRIDLSQVVNKYIGETEKNLKQIFDAAEEGGAILLFDEADALFGKRSDVKDSHDRYSNIEVSYLLQRMEAYGGLAVLTTNLKSAIDKAFLRRIRFVVQFPYPDAWQRAEIWRRVFPAGTPVKDLDMEKLSRLSVPGGNIRNIALNAAFLAANENTPVQMSHISRAARSEYSKIEKSFSNAETGGW